MTYKQLVKQYGKDAVDRELQRLLDLASGRKKLRTYEGRRALKEEIDRARRERVGKEIRLREFRRKDRNGKPNK